MTDWNSGFGYDCDNAAQIGGEIGSPVGAAAFGGGATAATLALASNPVTLPEVVLGGLGIAGAFHEGQQFGHQVGADIGYGGCEATNHFLDWLEAPPADATPSAPPAYSPSTVWGGWDTNAFDFSPNSDVGGSSHSDNGSTHHADTASSGHSPGHDSVGDL